MSLGRVLSVIFTVMSVVIVLIATMRAYQSVERDRVELQSHRLLHRTLCGRLQTRLSGAVAEAHQSRHAPSVDFMRAAYSEVFIYADMCVPDVQPLGDAAGITEVTDAVLSLDRTLRETEYINIYVGN